MLSRTQRLQNERKRKRKRLLRTGGVVAIAAALCAVIVWGWSVMDRPHAPGDRAISPDAGAPGQPGEGSVPPSANTSPGDSSPKPDDGTNGSEPRVEMAFVGDVMFAGNVETELKRRGFDYPYVNVKPILEKADITVANLETPVTTRGEKREKQYAYRSSPEALSAFKEAGFDLVNLANNHILDYGVQGLIDTLEHLDNAGIRRVGAGRNVAEAFRPAVIKINGIKTAFVGLSKVVPNEEWKAGMTKDGKERPGVADTYALKKPLETIRQAKSEADLVVVIVHWGLERQDKPEPYQTEFARAYIDAGADLVVGGHPHVLQGFESYQGKWIAYSLGNFIFTMNPNPATWESIILQASCSKSGDCRLKAIPVRTKLADPTPMDEASGAQLFRRLTDISFGAVVDEDGAIRVAPRPAETPPVAPSQGK